jgi:phage tail-like protein
MARNDRFVGHQWALRVNGADVGKFVKVTGLKASYDVIEERDNGDPDYKRKQRGLKKVDNVTLTQGITADANYLGEWFTAGDHRSVDVILDRADGKQVSYTLENAIPIEYVPFSDLDAENNSALIRTLVLAVEDISDGKVQ